jgi:hypothetical protein
MFSTLKPLILEAKIALWQHFAFSYPAFLRKYGIRVVPVGARP